jgi:beta-glucosidase
VGNYSGTPPRYITVLEGIRREAEFFGGIRVNYSMGCHLWKDRVEDLGEPSDRIGEAVAVSENSDIVILCVGLDASVEGEQGDASNAYGSGDKRDIYYPEPQLELMEKIKETGKPVILVSLSGSAMDLRYAAENFDGIIQGWYPGGEGGKALAELIFGKFSPSGKLPVTFYRSVEDIPDFCDYSMKGRTYKFIENEPLYPFGYGLSYTKFDYSAVSLENIDGNTQACNMQACNMLACNTHVCVKVKNIGGIGGYEKVQCYIEKAERSANAPKWQLKGFKPLFLNVGEEKEVSFILKADDFALIDENGDKIIEKGVYKIHIGGGQPDGRTFGLTQTQTVCFEITI